MPRRFEGAKSAEATTFGVAAVRAMLMGPPPRFDEADEPEASIRELADDIYANGQRQLVEVRADSAGRPVLIDGRRRRLAVLYINDHPELYPDTPADGWPLLGRATRATEEQAVLMTLAANRLRKALSPIDKMVAAMHLVDRLGMTQEDAATQVGVASQGELSKLLQLHVLPRPALKLVHDGRLRVNQARQLLGLTPEQIAPLVAQIDLGSRPSRVLATLKETRSAKVGMAVFRRQLAEIGGSVATDLLAHLDGDPTVNLDLILAEAGLRRQGVETRAVDYAELLKAVNCLLDGMTPYPSALEMDHDVDGEALIDRLWTAAGREGKWTDRSADEGEAREAARPRCPTHHRPLQLVDAPEGFREAWACDAQGCAEHPWLIADPGGLASIVLP
jgi:ParB-like chromosome segregation protein Spo0J